VRVLLDTNAYSALRRGQKLVAERVRSSEEVLLSIVVVGELLFGFRNGSRYEENTKDLQSFAGHPKVRLVPVTWATADLFGQLSAKLRKKARPIPTNDIWIAAHAIETGADLVSSDPHLGHLDDLPWIAFPAV
jgi:tRNA(fMet)-specific endonuclease VapC